MIAGFNARRALLASGDRPLLYGLRGGFRTGRALLDRVDRLAGALIQRKLQGRRIGVCYWNSFAAIEAFLAVEWVGGTRVPVDPAAAPSEARAIFAAAQVDAVMADGVHATQLGGEILVHDEAEPMVGPSVMPGVEVSPDTPLIFRTRMVTSGHALAASISYGNWEERLRRNQELYRSKHYGPPLDETDCFLTAQQILYGTGHLGTFPFLLMGIPQVIIEQFDSEAVVEAIDRHGVTTTFFVPGMVTRLVDSFENMSKPPRSLRRILYGGARLAVAEIRRALRVLGPILTQVYGRLEAGWPITILDVEDHRAILGGNDRRAASCGRVAPNIEIRLRPLRGMRTGMGELCVRGGEVVADYADADGWCGLGDVAEMDDDGYLYLGARLDRMINTGSYHVYPDEIEEAIRDVPSVRDVLVTGEPDPVWGNAVTAYIVPTEPRPDEALAETVRDALRARLANYKVPKKVYLVTRLPEIDADTSA